MYERTAPGRGSGRGGRRNGKDPEEGGSRTLLVQLLVCLVLFLVVYAGKGAFPARLMEVREEVLGLLGADTDFRSAFSELGRSLREEGELLDRLEDFCVEVFGGAGPETPDGSGAVLVSGSATGPVPDDLSSVTDRENRFFLTRPDSRALLEHYLYVGRLTLPVPDHGTIEAVPAQPGVSPTEVEDQTRETAEVGEQSEEAVPAAGTLILASDYSGDPLPEHYTMDQLSLGQLETITPVVGHVNSPYGYRDHPINGRWQFHGGVDIGAGMGDPIRAFAAGTVEYVGEDDSYGLYLQLDHGNGVKSFYAHCSRILVSRGQAVALGETVAEVGATGSATGPHLHLELKFEKTHLNPVYYIETLSR